MREPLLGAAVAVLCLELVRYVGGVELSVAAALVFGLTIGLVVGVLRSLQRRYL